MVINSITFSPGGGAFFLGGNALRFDGGASNSITQSSSSAESIANNFVAPASNTTQTINLTGNGTGVVTLSGVISPGTGQREYTVIKTGTSTFVLSGNNTYGGSTAVNGGTLLVNGALGTGSVSVSNAGTTLGGTGTVGGTSGVIVGTGTNIAPGNGGNSTGILTTTGQLTLASNSNFRVDINGTTPGSGHDQINSNPAGISGVTITGSNLVVTVGTTLSVGQTFTILLKNSAGLVTGTFAQGSTVMGSDGTVFSINYTGGDGNDIVLTVTAAPVPEPSTWIGGALAIAGLAFTQRRRLRKMPIRRYMF